MSQSATQDAENSLPDVSIHDKEKDSPAEYPSIQKQILIMISLYLSILLVTLV
jgi:hypothetical protein